MHLSRGRLIRRVLALVLAALGAPGVVVALVHLGALPIRLALHLDGGRQRHGIKTHPGSSGPVIRPTVPLALGGVGHGEGQQSPRLPLRQVRRKGDIQAPLRLILVATHPHPGGIQARQRCRHVVPATSKQVDGGTVHITCTRAGQKERGALPLDPADPVTNDNGNATPVNHGVAQRQRAARDHPARHLTRGGAIQQHPFRGGKGGNKLSLAPARLAHRRDIVDDLGHCKSLFCPPTTQGGRGLIAGGCAPFKGGARMHPMLSPNLPMGGRPALTRWRPLDPGRSRRHPGDVLCRALHPSYRIGGQRLPQIFAVTLRVRI